MWDKELRIPLPVLSPTVVSSLQYLLLPDFLSINFLADLDGFVR